MILNAATIIHDFKYLLEGSRGNLNREVNRATSVEKASFESLVFASNTKQLQIAVHNKAGVIITNPKILLNTDLNISNSTIITTLQVDVAMALILQKYFNKTLQRIGPAGISDKAFVDTSAVIGANCTIAGGAYVGANVTIKNNTKIGANVVIENHAKIGDSTILHSGVVIGAECIIGNNCEIHSNTTIGSDGYGFVTDKQTGTHIKIPQLGIVVISDNVEIGANCAIDRATFDQTIIEDGTKIDNLCHIAHNCQIGKNCLITGGFFVAGSSKIGDNFVCGGQSSVSDHVAICANVMLAGLSTVIKDICQPGIYGGYPLQPLKEHLKTLSSLPSLPEIRKEITAIKRKITERISE